MTSKRVTMPDLLDAYGRPAVAAGLRVYYRHLVWGGLPYYDADAYVKAMTRRDGTLRVSSTIVRAIRTRARAIDKLGAHPWP